MSKHSNFNTKITKSDRSLHDLYAFRDLPRMSLSHREWEEKSYRFDLRNEMMQMEGGE